MELRPVSLDDLPCNTPVIMMTMSGDTLGMPKAEACFVELIGTNDGLVTIRSAEDKWQRLTRGYHRPCRFGRPAEALKFEPKMSPTGRLVFELEGTGHVLGFAMEGQSKVLICREEYWKDTQSWMLLQQQTRRQLYQTEYDGQSCCKRERIGWSPPLWFGVALENPVTTATAIAVERRRHILKMLMSGKSPKDARDILTLMYWTSSPILNIDASSGIRGTELRVSSDKLGQNQDKEESETQYISVSEVYECSDYASGVRR
ncbi:hypothetical protein PHYPSEUDO_008586 [Phytophthora pseudosyringae]|uniref:Uncharacterized protein n=1 Tax=Phytophthora pseudosyringae TaxID=221518 RepID=A0A8T1VDV8_9STRA|nr:hypothetical protein PHYPSEUDO_008586 [Phytophthora pseudosyringae]